MTQPRPVTFVIPTDDHYDKSVLEASMVEHQQEEASQLKSARTLFLHWHHSQDATLTIPVNGW